MRTLLIFFSILFVLSYCKSTSGNIQFIETVENIMQDETIPEEVKIKVAKKIIKENLNEIKVVSKRNKELEEKIKENQWKVDLVDTIILLIIITIVFFVIWKLFRFYLKMKGV